MQIRTFVEDDRRELVALWHRCELVRGSNDPDRDIDTKIGHDDGLFVAIERTQVVGSVMVGFDGHRGWINYLAVLPERRRAGIGRLLINHAEAHLRAMGCPKINLQVRRANVQVAAFYEAAAYAVDDVVSWGKRIDR
jgi:ribosomal protein S18 acetylase RimI-like enzyme